MQQGKAQQESVTPNKWPELNSDQKAAATAPLRPQLVVAGPGTGKTRVLVCHAAHLILEKGFDPERVVLVTFTRQAAAELTERLTEIVGPAGTNVQAGTLHHFCYQILKDHPETADVPSDFIVAGETTTDPFWQRWHEENEDWCERNDLKSYQQVKTHVGRVKLGIDTVSGRLQKGMRRYRKMLRKRNAVDFDDLLVKTRDLLQDNETRRAVSKDAGAILVDEFQDTDPVQYEILRRLGEDAHLFCVADGDQSVYRFRGARPENLQRYIEDFDCRKENGGLRVLGTNYRTSQAIYDVAESVLDRSGQIKSRGDIQAQNSGSGEVRVKACGNPEKERRFARDTVRQWLEEDRIPESEIAILTRWNSRARELEEAFLKDGIACRTSSSDDLMETPPAQKLQALLQVIDARRREQGVEAPLAELLGQMLSGHAMAGLRDFQARSMPDQNLWTVFQTVASSRRARRSAHLEEEIKPLKRAYATITNLLQRSQKPRTTIGEFAEEALRELEDPLQLLQKEEEKLEDPASFPAIREAGRALRTWKADQVQGVGGGPRLLLHSREPQLTRLWRQLVRRALGIETDPPAPLPEKQEALFVRPAEEGIPPLGNEDLVFTNDIEGLFDWGERTGAFGREETPTIVVLTSQEFREAGGRLPLGIDPAEVIAIGPEDAAESPSVQLFKALGAATGPDSAQPLFPEYVMVDIEATSTDPRSCTVAEIGAVKVEDGTTTGRFSKLIELPEDLSGEEAQTLRDVCGLDPETDFSGARPIDEVWAAFCEFVGEAPLVAHNGQQYDFKVLDRLAREQGTGAPWNATFDMLPAAHELFPDLNRHDAEHLKQEVVGEKEATAHRALADCVDQQQILSAMQKKRARRERMLAHESLLPLVVAALTYESPDPDTVTRDTKALLRVGHVWALRGASPTKEDLQSMLPRALPDRFRKDPLYAAIDEEELIEEATGIQPGLKRRLEALLSPFADGLLKSERLEDLLAHLTLWGEAETPEGKEVVTISTYHSAKGLEFERVICTDVHNNAFPPFFARDPAERRESRRLLYVGMTRAERRLVLTYPKIDREYERSITPFLEGVEERLSTSRPDAPAAGPPAE